MRHPGQVLSRQAGAGGLGSHEGPHARQRSLSGVSLGSLRKQQKQSVHVCEPVPGPRGSGLIASYANRGVRRV